MEFLHHERKIHRDLKSKSGKQLVRTIGAAQWSLYHYDVMGGGGGGGGGKGEH